MVLSLTPPCFTEAIDKLNNDLFWSIKALESFVEAVNDTNPDLWEQVLLSEKYERSGYPLGKTRRGFKKWIRRQGDILDAEILE